MNNKEKLKELKKENLLKKQIKLKDKEYDILKNIDKLETKLEKVRNEFKNIEQEIENGKVNNNLWSKEIKDINNNFQPSLIKSKPSNFKCSQM